MSIGTYFITGGSCYECGNAIDQTGYSTVINNPLNKLKTSQRWMVSVASTSPVKWTIQNEQYKTFLRPGPNFNELVTSESAFYWRTQPASNLDPNIFVFFAGDDVGDKGYYAYWGSQGDNVRLAYSTFDLAFDHDDTKSWYFEQAT